MGFVLTHGHFNKVAFNVQSLSEKLCLPLSYSLLFLLGFFYISLHHCSLSLFPSQSLCDLFFQVSISLSLFPLLFSSTLVFPPFFPSFLLSSLPSRGRWMPSQSLLSEVSSCKSFFLLSMTVWCMRLENYWFFMKANL